MDPGGGALSTPNGGGILDSVCFDFDEVKRPLMWCSHVAGRWMSDSGSNYLCTLVILYLNRVVMCFTNKYNWHRFGSSGCLI